MAMYVALALIVAEPFLSFLSPTSLKLCETNVNLSIVTAFTVHETIHLIDPEELKVTDPRSFPGSEYCPVAEHKLRPRDAKVHFVAIILSRPVLGADQRLTWTVADKSGVVSGPGRRFSRHRTFSLSACGANQSRSPGQFLLPVSRRAQ